MFSHYNTQTFFKIFYFCWTKFHTVFMILLTTFKLLLNLLSECMWNEYSEKKNYEMRVFFAIIKMLYPYTFLFDSKPFHFIIRSYCFWAYGYKFPPPNIRILWVSYYLQQLNYVQMQSMIIHFYYFLPVEKLTKKTILLVYIS